jgi:hypothetical protein
LLTLRPGSWPTTRFGVVACDSRRCLLEVGQVVRFQVGNLGNLGSPMAALLEHRATEQATEYLQGLLDTVATEAILEAMQPPRQQAVPQHRRRRGTSANPQHPVLKILRHRRTRTMRSSPDVSGCQSSSTVLQDKILMQLHVRLSKHVSQDALGRRRHLLLRGMVLHR